MYLFRLVGVTAETERVSDLLRGGFLALKKKPRSETHSDGDKDANTDLGLSMAGSLVGVSLELVAQMLGGALLAIGLETSKS